jgi:hypothetical protein
VNTYVCICIYSKVLGTRSHKFLQIERHPQPWSWELWIATETEIKVSVWQKEIIKLTPNLTVTCTSLGHISLFLNNNKALLGHHLVKSTYPESSVFIIRIAGVWPHVFPQNRNYKTRENHLFKNLLGSHSSISSKRASLSICSYYCPNLSSLNKINPFHIFTSWGMLICDTLWSALHPEYQAPVTCVERVGQRGAFLVNFSSSVGCAISISAWCISICAWCSPSVKLALWAMLQKRPWGRVWAVHLRKLMRIVLPWWAMDTGPWSLVHMILHSGPRARPFLVISWTLCM